MAEVGRQDDERQHQVTLTRGFLIWKYEVTQSVYQSLMGYTRSEFAACGPSCPVDCVHWM